MLWRNVAVVCVIPRCVKVASATSGSKWSKALERSSVDTYRCVVDVLMMAAAAWC